MRYIYSRNKKSLISRLRNRFINLTTAIVLAVTGLGGGLAPLLLSSTVHATGSAITVTPTSLNGWAESDTRPGGATSYIADSSSPNSVGALQLTTDNTNAAKADYMHAAPAGTLLSNISELGYSSKQLAASWAGGNATFQLAVNTAGANGGFTTLVYEPYWQNNGNPDAAPVQPNSWQTWNVTDGLFWSSKTVGGLTAGGGGSPFYTLSQVKSMFPDATVLGYGLAVGSYNPSYTINVASLDFNGTTFNFEPVLPVTDVTTGISYPTIQSAINACSSTCGDTIKVSAGTYNESVNINKPVVLLGAQANVDPRPSANSTRTIDSSNESVVTTPSSKTVFNISTNNVTINGFEIKQAGGNGADTINTTSNFSNITISNNIVTNTSTANAMHLYGGENFLVDNNYLDNIAGQGIVLRNGNKATPVASNQKIINNDLSNVQGTNNGAIVEYGESDLEIAGNIIHAAYQGISLGATGNYYENNINVHNNTVYVQFGFTKIQDWGILVDGISNGITIKYNSISQEGSGTNTGSLYPLIKVAYNDPTSASNPQNLLISDNNLTGTSATEYLTVGPNVTNTINATNNWWGSQANPSAKVVNSSQANVTTSPWLCEAYTGQTNPRASVNGTCEEVPGAPTNLNIKFQYDTQPLKDGAIINITSKDNGHNNLVLNWTVPTNAPVDHYITTVNRPDGTTDTQWNGYPNTWLTQNGFSFGQHGNGVYIYTVTAYNSAGASQTSAPISLGFDNQAPTVQFTSPTGNYLNTTKPFTISGTYNDNLSGVNRIQLYISKGTSYNYNTHVGYLTATLTPTPNTLDGTFTYTLSQAQVNELSSKLGIQSGDKFTITAVAIDNAGNGQRSGNAWKDSSITLTADNNIPKILSGNVSIVNPGNYTSAFLNSANGGKLKVTITTDEPITNNSGAVLLQDTNPPHLAYDFNNQTQWYNFTQQGNSNTYIAYIDLNDPVLAGKSLNGMLIDMYIADAAGNYYYYLFSGTAGSYTTPQNNNWLYLDVDNTIPTDPTGLVWKDGGGNTLGTYTNLNLVAPTWAASSDPGSGVAYYEYAYSHTSSLSDTPVWHIDSTHYTGTSTGPTSFGTTAGQQGVWRFEVRAVDNAGNYSNWVASAPLFFDNTAPNVSTPTFTPNTDGTQSVTLSASDNTGGSGLASIYYTTDGSDPTTSSTRTLYTGAFNISPSVAPNVTTITAVAYDNAGNVSTPMAVAGPAITGQTSLTPTTNSIVLTWNTSEPATSRVIYDTVSHPTLGTGVNYGYAFSTTEDSTKVTSHSVTISSLTPGTTYYFRMVSHGSPETVSQQLTGLTLVTPAVTNNAGTTTPPVFHVNFAPATTAPTATTGNGNVLGAQTTTPTASNSGNDQGHVKGDQTVKKELVTNASTTNKNFLGLGWWWLLILAVIVAFFWWLAVARKKQDDKA